MHIAGSTAREAEARRKKQESGGLENVAWPFTVAQGYAVDILKSIRDHVNQARSNCRHGATKTMEFVERKVCVCARISLIHSNMNGGQHHVWL